MDKEKQSNIGEGPGEPGFRYIEQKNFMFQERRKIEKGKKKD